MPVGIVTVGPVIVFVALAFRSTPASVRVKYRRIVWLTWPEIVMRYVPPVCSTGLLRQPLVLESRMQRPLASDPSGFLIVPVMVTAIACPVGAAVGVGV